MRKWFVSILSCAFSFSLAAGKPFNFISYDHLLIFPHQVAVADTIFTGTVISNINGHAVQFAIEETLWGNTHTSNISVRCVRETEELSLPLNDKYLVFAFTNNWWAEKEWPLLEHETISLFYLSDFKSPTNRPKNKAVFTDFRIMDHNLSVINFEQMNFDGTNYWNDTRAFITNFLEITRIQNNEVKAFRKISSIMRTPKPSLILPRWLRHELFKYDLFRFEGVEPGPSSATQPSVSQQ